SPMLMTLKITILSPRLSRVFRSRLGGSGQLVQQGFRPLQVCCCKTFGEAVVNRPENSRCLGRTALTVQQPGMAEGDPKLPKQGALLSGHLTRPVEAVFGCGSGPIPGLLEQHLALDAEQFGDIPLLAVFPPHSRLDRLAYGIVRLVEPSKPRERK